MNLINQKLKKFVKSYLDNKKYMIGSSHFLEYEAKI